MHGGYGKSRSHIAEVSRNESWGEKTSPFVISQGVRRMRWEKLSQSCQTIIAWIFLLFVVGTFLALIIMKVTAEESLFYLVLTTNVFLVLSLCLLFVFYLLTLPASFLLSSLLVTHSPPSPHTHTHTHTHGI